MGFCGIILSANALAKPGRRLSAGKNKEETSMKRTISFLLALLLALAAVTCAAAEGNVFKTGYFTIGLPDGWEADTTPLDDEEEEEGFEYLGVFFDTKKVGLLVSTYLLYYEEYKGFSLWKSNEADLKLYAETVMEDFAEDHPEYLGTVMAGTIPFVLIMGTDEDGEYLYANTVTNGYIIVFNAIITNERARRQYPVTDEYIEQFKNVLSTFQPVT